MKKQIILSVIGLMILTLSWSPNAFGQTGGTFEIKQSVIASGGGKTEGGSFSVDGVIGQSAAGQQMNGGNFSVSNGFWASNSTVAAINRTRFDFDGDGKADQSVFRPSNGVWYILRSAQGSNAATLGASTDKLVPADFDGDGKTDVAVFRNGVWYWLNSSDNSYKFFQWGVADDIPVPANYDADTKDNIAVFRPSNGVWYILNSDNSAYSAYAFGANGDKPVPADYDADGKTDIAVFRPSNGVWYLQRSAQGFTGVAFGEPTDLPTPADFDGDGKTDIAVFRPSNGVWYRLNSSNNQFQTVTFGAGTDKPVLSAYVY